MNSNKIYIDNKLDCRCLLLAINDDDIIFKNSELLFFMYKYKEDTVKEGLSFCKRWPCSTYTKRFILLDC